MDEGFFEATGNEGPHLKRRFSLIKAAYHTQGFSLNPTFGSSHEHFWVSNKVSNLATSCFVQRIVLFAAVLCSKRDVTLISYKECEMAHYKSNGK